MDLHRDKEILEIYQHIQSECKQRLDDAREYDAFSERLIEVMAYLSACLSSELKSQWKRLCLIILEQIDNSMNHPKPLYTMLQFNDHFMNPNQTKIDKHASLSAQWDKDMTSFRMINELVIYPIRLESVISDVEENVTHISLRFNFLYDNVDKQIDVISIFLDTDKERCMTIAEMLLSKQTEWGLELDEKRVEIEPERIIYPYSDLFDENPQSLTKAYFSDDPTLYVFGLDLRQIDLTKSTHFTLVLRTELKCPIVNIMMFKLHCAKVENSYVKDLEPVRIDGKQISYPLELDIDMDNEVLYEVLDVISDLKEIHFLPLAAYHSTLEEMTYYRIIEEEYKRGAYRIVLSGTYALYPQTLSVRARLCRREIEIDDRERIEFKMKGSDALSVKNIRPISKPKKGFNTAQTEDYLREGLYLNDLMSLELPYLKKTLKRMIHFPSDLSKIEGIESLVINKITRIENGAWQEIIHVLLSLKMSAYQCKGDCVLFSRILHDYFSQMSHFGHFIQTTVQFSEINETLIWEPYRDSGLLKTVRYI